MFESLRMTILELIFVIILPVLGSELVRKHEWFSRWSLKQWWLLFTGASIADVVSTYVMIYVRSLPWAIEQNILIIWFGPLVGHGWVLLAYNIIALFLFYIIARRTHDPTRRNFFVWFFCVSSSIRIGAAVYNFIYVR